MYNMSIFVFILVCYSFGVLTAIIMFSVKNGP